MLSTLSSSCSVRFIGPNSKIASGRYRTAMPAQWLYQNGVREGDDILVVGKHAWPYDFTETYDKYIFDICDDHFQNEWRDHYMRHCENASAITCNSDMMREIIREQTGRIAFVIPDPVEGERKIPKIGPNLLWFGHQSNFKCLQRVMPDLVGYDLGVVSDLEHPLVTKYTEEAMAKAFSNAGMVVIPVNKEKPAKSANRLMRAVQAGLYVVAEPHPSHLEFSEMMYIGDIRAGVDAAMDDPLSTLESIKECQDYINEHYSIDKIGRLWQQVIWQVSKQR